MGKREVVAEGKKTVLAASAALEASAALAASEALEASAVPAVSVLERCTPGHSCGIAVRKTCVAIAGVI